MSNISNCGCKKNRLIQPNIIEMMNNYEDLTSNFDSVSDYYSNFDIEEFANINSSRGNSVNPILERSILFRISFVSSQSEISFIT